VNRSWYFDLTLISDYLTVSHRYHHTASATLFYALHESLAIIDDEDWTASATSRESARALCAGSSGWD